MRDNSTLSICVPGLEWKLPAVTGFPFSELVKWDTPGEPSGPFKSLALCVCWRLSAAAVLPLHSTPVLCTVTSFNPHDDPLGGGHPCPLPAGEEAGREVKAPHRELLRVGGPRLQWAERGPRGKAC